MIAEGCFLQVLKIVWQLLTIKWCSTVSCLVFVRIDFSAVMMVRLYHSQKIAC